jgi:hypothetical protein
VRIGFRSLAALDTSHGAARLFRPNKTVDESNNRFIMVATSK